jgi:hypothetical protein
MKLIAATVLAVAVLAAGCSLDRPMDVHRAESTIESQLQSALRARTAPPTR